ncbi:hypothetical protein SARC_04859 [Sphaeroforma arctica JP610]|uniref:Uncharacterized protein n=1 Tax=Sphaeroforma arctica JP610 TaxID=667725 RepID=A0A0L0G1Z4_9EUKA|nr:hypothetical protein SARC_04859 [Sphaeroforma arctica JP610]KNC82859.1 hypothetical protein SARC_04859 [Sphaeroforma arctica JP610]|eukprot:XP_014156761.1 hypothetical protein SARC_04859 [Sphaeroforma arctica JP610]
MVRLRTGATVSCTRNPSKHGSLSAPSSTIVTPYTKAWKRTAPKLSTQNEFIINDMLLENLHKGASQDRRSVHALLLPLTSDPFYMDRLYHVLRHDSTLIERYLDNFHQRIAEFFQIWLENLENAFFIGFHNQQAGCSIGVAILEESFVRKYSNYPPEPRAIKRLRERDRGRPTTRDQGRAGRNNAGGNTRRGDDTHRADRNRDRVDHDSRDRGYVNGRGNRRDSDSHGDRAGISRPRHGRSDDYDSSSSRNDSGVGSRSQSTTPAFNDNHGRSQSQDVRPARSRTPTANPVTPGKTLTVRMCATTATNLVTKLPNARPYNNFSGTLNIRAD